MSCPACFQGTAHNAVAKGKEVKIYGLEAYVTEPEGPPKGIVVYIPDAFGWKFINNRVLADLYAEKGGYRVYIPEAMAGRAPPSWTLETMDFVMGKASIFATLFIKPIKLLQVLSHFIPFFFLARKKNAYPRIENFVINLRKDPANADYKVGTVGFCWGGLHALTLGAGTPTAPPLVDAVFVAHPSFSTSKEVAAVNVPLSLIIGDKDAVMSLSEVKKGEAALNKKSDDHEIVVVPGAKHGFAVRGDPSDPKQADFAVQALNQALAWFKKWIG